MLPLVAVSTGRGRHRRVLPGPVPGLLLGLAGGGLALMSVLPAVASSPEPVPPTPQPASTGAPVARDDDDRASRSRRQVLPSTPEPEATPTTSTPVAAPAAPVLPGCAGRRPDLSRYANGRLPGSTLCDLPGPSAERLRADAAVAFVRLAAGYQAAFGEPICVTDGYRTLAEQVQLRRTKPRFAARPGFSEHGWGLAVDLSCGVQSFRTDRHAWLVQNAQRFGWSLPDWAARGGSRPEPWHWEFVEA